MEPIDVGERLPEVRPHPEYGDAHLASDPVLAWCVGGDAPWWRDRWMTAVFVRKKGGGGVERAFWDPEIGIGQSVRVTHWAPLPAPPEKPQ